MSNIKLAVVGATGVVGQKMIEVLEEKNLPIDEYVFFSSKRSAGKTVKFHDDVYIVKELTEDSLKDNFSFALFSAGGDVSLKFAPIAAKNNCIVIDNSSAFRMDSNVPLVVPEVNPDDIKWHNNIIANPNCSTIQAVCALKPLDDAFGIKRIVYSTYLYGLKSNSETIIWDRYKSESILPIKHNESSFSILIFNVLSYWDETL